MRLLLELQAVHQITIPDIGDMSSQKLQHMNISVMLGFVWLTKCKRSFILKVRFYSIGVKRAECIKEWVTDLVLLSR